METAWSREYEVSSFLVNPQKRLGLYSTLNLLQDVAWLHAKHLGHGFDESRDKNAFFVLSRQKLVMNEWPAWGETVRITTWLREPQPPFVYRDFELFRGDKKIGEATTVWVCLDTQTRKPMRTAVLRTQQSYERALSFEAVKIEAQKGLQKTSEFEVRNSDLDMNEHVNNTRYAQWVLDSIPQTSHLKYKLHSYEANFITETKSGDVAMIEKGPRVDVSVGHSQVQFQGVRKSDGKLLFVARVEISDPDISIT